MASRHNTKRVKLQDLFRWKQRLAILDEAGEEVAEVYQRVLSDHDLDKARLESVRFSRKFRLALRDTGSLEHDVLMESMNNFEAEQQKQVILAYKLQEFIRRANKESKTVMPNSPGSEATLEQLEEYEAAVDEFDKKKAEELASIVEALKEVELKRMAGLSENDLATEAAKAMEDNICQSVANERLTDWFAYMATYEDAACTKRYFDSIEDYEEVSGAVKRQLAEGYQKLLLPPEDLKN